MSQGKCCCFANGGNPAASRNCVLPPLAWAALAAVLLGGPAAARAAVTLTDTASFASYWNTGGTQALGIPSFNVSSGADVLVVEVGMSDTSKSDTLALSYGGQSLTPAIQQISSQSGNYLYSDIYYLYNPNPGTNSISFTLPSSAAECAYNAFSLSGANTGIAPIISGGDVTSGAATNSVTLSGTSALSAGSFAAVDYSVASSQTRYSKNASVLSATSGAAQSWFANNSANNSYITFGGGYISGPSPGNLTVTTSRAPAGQTGTNRNELAVAVFAPGLTNLLWTNNAGSSVWSFAPSDTNWNSPAVAYVEPAAVTFDDTPGADQSVVLSAAVAPLSITFSNSQWNYSLSSSGGGSIGGSGSVSINGPGNVAFNLANSYSGATTINGGALQLGHSNALVNSTAVVNAANGLGFSGGIGTFKLGGLAGNGSFALSDAGGGPVTLQVGGNGATTQFSGNISGSGNLTKVGSGTLTFSGTNTYNGNTTISQGALAANGATVGSGTIYLMNGATFRPVGVTPGLGVAIYTGAPAYNGNTTPISVFNTLAGLNTFVSGLPLEFTGSTSTGTAGGVNFPNVTNPANCFASIGYNPPTTHAGGQGQFYTAVLSGYINLPAGPTGFSTSSDDGSMLFIDGNAVVNNNNYQGMALSTGTVNEATAGPHQIVIAYYQGGGGNGLYANSPVAANNSPTNYLVNGTGTDQIYSIGGAAGFANNLVVSGTATLDLTAGTVSFPLLSIGATGTSTLHVIDGPGTATFAGTIIANSPVFDVQGSNVLNLGAISGSGALAALNFTTTGSGAVVVSGSSNTSGGTLSVNAGSLVAVGQNAATGPLGSAGIFLNNATLGLANSSAAGTTFDLISNNRLTLAGSNDSIIAGSLLAGSPNGAVTLGGTGTLAIAASQTLNLGAVNGYTLGFAAGFQFSNSGTLAASAGNVSLSASNLAASAGTLSATNGGTLTMASPVSSGYFSPAAGGVLILGNTYSGALANLAPAVGGTLVIANNVTAGTLNVANGAYVATASSSFGPATLQLNGGTLAGATAPLTVPNALLWGSSSSGTLNFGGNANLTLSGSLNLGSGTYYVNDPAGVGTLSGLISGSGALSITGNPTLSAANTYSGGTTFNNATNAAITNNRAFGTGTITFNNGGFSATVPLTGGNALSNPYTWTNNQGMYINGAQSIELSGPGTISGGSTGNIDVAAASTLTLSGSLSGNGTLHKQSSGNNTAGVLILTGSNSGFSGTFYIDANSATTYFGNNAVLGSGTLNVGNGGINIFAGTPTAGANVVLPNAVILNGGIGIQSANGGNLSFSGPVNLAATAAVYSYNPGTMPVTFSGLVSGTGGFTAISANGTGGTQPVLLSNPNNSYSGATSVVYGTLIAGANVPASGAGAFGYATTANATLQVGDTSAGQGGTYTEPAALLAANGSTIARPINVLAGNPGVATLGGYDNTANLTFSGSITLNKNVALSAAVGGSVLFSGVISGSGGITAASPAGGNVSLIKVNSYGGPTVLSSGQLTLDYSRLTPVAGSVGGIVPPASPVTLSGGTLVFNGYPAAPVNQTFVSTTVANFGSSLVVNPNSGQPVNIALGGITRSGGVLMIPNSGTFTTTNSNSAGILGGYATYNGSDWAAVSGGAIGPLASYNTNDFSSGTNNVDVVSGGTPSPFVGTVNSLRFNSSTASSLTLPGGLTLASGGILVTAGVGTTSLGINGASLTASGTTASNTLADVVVNQFDTAAPFTIGAALTNSGSTAIGLTKGGPGLLILAGSNTFSGPTTVSGGMLQGSLGAGNFPVTTSIALNYGAGVDFVENGALAVTSTISVSGAGTLSKDGSQALTMTGSLPSGGLNVLNGTLNLIGNDAIGPLAGSGALNITGTLSENPSSPSSKFDGPLGGSGLFIMLGGGTGTLTLTNSGSTFGGTVRIGTGTLQLKSPLALQDATLDMNTADAGTLDTSTGSLSSLVLGGLMGVRNLSAPAALTIGGNNSSTTYAGILGGANSLTKAGSGTLFLSGANGFASATITGGGLDVTTTASLPGYATPNAVTVNAGAGLTVQTGNGTNGWSNGQILSLLGGSWANNTLLGIDTTNGSSTYSGNIGQSPTLTKLGANTLALSGSISTGLLTVSAGAVNILSANPSVSGLSGSGGIVLGGPQGTNLTVYSASNSAFSGVISQGAAAGSLTKFGAATLTLGGASSYAGGTNLNQGTVVATNVNALGSGPLNLAGGTLRFNLPSWTSVDIGAPAIAGSASYSAGAWTIIGAGADVWTTNDQCHYVYVPATTSSPATWIAHVSLLLGNTGDTGWTKVGIMARASTNTLVADTYTAETTSQNVTFQWTSGTAATATNNDVTGGSPAPQWIEMTYDGAGNFTSYYSNSTSATPPTTWTQLGTQQNVTMPAGGFDVGLFVTSHNTAATSTGVFDYNNLADINLPGNNITASQASTLDLGNAPRATFGALAFVNTGATLSITGSGPYQATVGATSLAGSATLNVASYGSGQGTLSVGALSGSGNLTMNGPGALVLTAAANGFSGTTTLNAGTLVASNGSAGSATGSGPVTLNGGLLASDPNLGGTFGTLGSLVSAGSGVQIAPGGIGAVGSLTIGGSLALSNSATLDFDVSGNTADLLTITKALSVSGVVNVALSITGSPTVNPIVLAAFPANNGLSQGNFSATGLGGSGYTFTLLTVSGTDELVLKSSNGPAIWTSPSSGNWSDGTRWSTGSAPGSGKGAVAVVGADTSTPITVALDVPTTLGQLAFSSTAGGGYTLAAGGGTLTMDNGTNNNGIAQILVASGSHGISAPVILAGALSIVPSAGTTLGCSGNISEETPGAGSLSLDGPGTLILGGSDSYTGGTRVTAGTLIVTSSNSLADNTNLSVAGGGTFIFDPSVIAAPAAGALTAAAPAGAVPEPGTLALLSVVGIAAAAAAWRRRKGA